MHWFFRACGLPLVAALVALSGTCHASCGSAFCAINTNWGVHGAWTEPGARADLRYEYIKQDQPMAGSDKVSVGQIPRHHDEVSTLNRNWLATFDYAFDAVWGMSVIVPLVDREHLHIHNHQGAQLPESWAFAELGDVRLLGRYRLQADEGPDGQFDSWGMTFGAKLPTGKFDVANEDGDKAERTLQPGSGTADALLGVYFRRGLPLQGLSWFADGLVQMAVNTREEFRPGDRLTLDLGVRYELPGSTTLMLQLNTLVKGRDTGMEAETDDSGGRFFFLSPGISYAPTRNLQIYAFVQLPVYQFVNGVQLVADRAFVAGISGRF
jgi:hypothetical protein